MEQTDHSLYFQFVQRNRTTLEQTDPIHYDEVRLLWENCWGFVQVCGTQAKSWMQQKRTTHGHIYCWIHW